MKSCCIMQLLKPAFTIVRDTSSQCFLLFIRGAISVKERLTAATGTEVPFHHIVVQEGIVSNLVLGYAHCGMVAAARWIAKQAIPCLTKAIEQFPEYEIKVISFSFCGFSFDVQPFCIVENSWYYILISHLLLCSFRFSASVLNCNSVTHNWWLPVYLANCTKINLSCEC